MFTISKASIYISKLLNSEALVEQSEKD